MSIKDLIAEGSKSQFIRRHGMAKCVAYRRDLQEVVDSGVDVGTGSLKQFFSKEYDMLVSTSTIASHLELLKKGKPLWQ